MKKTIGTLIALPVLALSSAIMSSTVAAEEHPASIFLTTGQYYFDDDEDGTPITIGAGYDFTQRWGGELSYTEIDSDLDGGTSIDFEHIQADALYYLGLGDWKPFLVAGLGKRETMTTSLPDVKSPFVNAGLGIKGKLSERFQLRGDVRAYHDLDDSYTDYGFNVGIGFLFGSRPSPVKAKPAPVVAAAPQVQDADMDGVSDSTDRCSSTPKGISVDRFGCAIDSDKDGVADHKDSCPNTATNYKVDAKGCPLSLSETVSIDLNIQFDNNSDVVKESYYSEIQKVADFMAQYAQTSVAIEGYTDDRGKAEYNQSLSQRRADAVRTVLVNRFNVSSDRVSATGYGEINPVASNDTAEGRAINRRVVAKVSSKVEKVITR